MEIKSNNFFARKKLIIIFILAILIPSLFVGYLSISTVIKRREVIKGLLETNLWISGENALKSIEDILFQDEKEILTADIFSSIYPYKTTNLISTEKTIREGTIAAQFFLLDKEYHIVYPKIRNEASSFLIDPEDSFGDKLLQTFKTAQSLELLKKNFILAISEYLKCFSLAKSEQEKALVLEGLGRCYLASGNNGQAEKIYLDLISKYGQSYNKAGHPYGLASSIQLFNVFMKQNKLKEGLEILLKSYKQIKEGSWALNQVIYDFFVLELESLLNQYLVDDKFIELQKIFETIQKTQFSYAQVLLYSDIFRRLAAPRIKENFPQTLKESGEIHNRIYISNSEGFQLISFAPLLNFHQNQDFLAVFFWDLEKLKIQRLPEILQEMGEKFKILLHLSEGQAEPEVSTQTDLFASNSISLSFREFPFPWRIFVSQSHQDELAKTSRQEILLFGIFLFVIFALMIMGAFLISRDISRKSETTRLKTEFVHNVSHELKTPLSLIRLYGETLQTREHLSDPEKKEAYEIITKESERLSHLINNILDFSKIEMGKKEFNFQKYSLHDLVAETLASYRYHLENNGFILKEDLSEDIPEMKLDKEAIASVLINLLSNALKYSQKNKEIVVRLFKEVDFAVLQVEDKGIGIPQKELSNIFKRFYKIRQKETAETGGSGLGLTLVKHIIEAHEGRVEVQSQLGAGSIFSIYLPFSNPDKDIA